MGEKDTNKVLAHFKKNKNAYIAGTAGVIVGAVGAVMLIARYNNIQIVDSYKIQLWSPTTNNISQFVLSPLGDPGNVVQRLEDETTWASQGQAARDLGVSMSTLRKHLQGKLPDIDGLHYKILGKAGQPLAS